jgi:cobalt/nickel transport protein
MSFRVKAKSSKKNLARQNIILVIIVVALIVIPLWVQRKAKFGGSDDQAKNAISEIDKNYKPWFHSIWTPPSSEIESLLFALQAGVGCLIIGYYIGYSRGRKKREDSEKS